MAKFYIFATTTAPNGVISLTCYWLWKEVPWYVVYFIFPFGTIVLLVGLDTTVLLV